ncbi:hypothetical protein AK812_SmicGene46313, partial [Symbiodinium microadriaticum]
AQFHIRFAKECAAVVEELDSFTLESVQCQQDFDKKFIHSAISQWYGSPEAFADYVRGPLRQELLSSTEAGLPAAYSFLIITPLLSLGADTISGLIKAHPPWQLLLSQFFGVLLGVFLCWGMVLVRAGIFLCDRFAGRSRSWLMDCGLSLLVFLGFVLTALAGVQGAVYATNDSLGASLVWFASVLVLLWLTHGGWAQVAKLKPKASFDIKDRPDKTGCNGRST